VSKEEDEDRHKAVAQLLSKEIAAGRIRIERWLTVEPAALVESGHIVCSVHHGGANSYFEAVRYVTNLLSKLVILTGQALVFPKLSYPLGLTPTILHNAWKC